MASTPFLQSAFHPCAHVGPVLNRRESDVVSGAFLRAWLINEGVILPAGETSYGRATFKALERARALATEARNAERTARVALNLNLPQRPVLERVA